MAAATQRWGGVCGRAVYQLGDGETICYFDPITQSLIVHNEGDVSSIVIIHLNHFFYYFRAKYF
jgi:hypothetical protein